MNWKEILSGLLGGVSLVALKPIVVAILAILGVVLLIIPIVIVWAYGLMTGLIFGVVTLLFIFVMHRTGLLDAEKYPWLILAPLVAFFAGVVVEKGRLFQFMPLQVTFCATFGALSESSAFFNITLSMTVIVVIGILLVIGLATRT